MPSSTTFVFIVSGFSAVFGDIQDFEKNSFASKGVKKMDENLENGKSCRNGTYLINFLVTISI